MKKCLKRFSLEYIILAIKVPMNDGTRQGNGPRGMQFVIIRNYLVIKSNLITSF